MTSARMNFPFLRDLAAALDAAAFPGAVPAAPSPAVMREIAIAMDAVVLLPEALEEYSRRVHPLVSAIHSADRRPVDIDQVPTLRPLSEAIAAEILAEPMGGRADDWLLRARIDLLALNLPALELLQDELHEFDGLPREWNDLLNNQWWLLRFGLPTEFEILAREVDLLPLGWFPATWNYDLGLPDVTAASPTVSGGRRGAPWRRHPFPRMVVRVRLDALEPLHVRGAENTASDEAVFEIAAIGRSLAVLTGGFAFVDADSTLSLRWLSTDGSSLNGPRAFARVVDNVKPQILEGKSTLRDGQRLEFAFERQGLRPYSVSGQLRLPAVGEFQSDDPLVPRATRLPAPPEWRIVSHGRAEVRRSIKVVGVGTVAGCAVVEGVVRHNSRLRLVRDGAVVVENRMVGGLQIGRFAAKEAHAGTECGVRVFGYDDVRSGDVLEFYDLEMVKQPPRQA